MDFKVKIFIPILLIYSLIGLCQSSIIKTPCEIQILKYNIKTKAINEPYLIEKGPVFFFTYDTVFTVNYPKRVDVVSEIDEKGKDILALDTSDHFTYNKLVDSISLNELDALLKSEIKIMCTDQPLKVENVRVKVYRSNGEFYKCNISSTKLNSERFIKKFIKKSPNNAYLIIEAIWFYLNKDKRIAIDYGICWKVSKNR